MLYIFMKYIFQVIILVTGICNHRTTEFPVLRNVGLPKYYILKKFSYSCNSLLYDPGEGHSQGPSQKKKLISETYKLKTAFSAPRRDPREASPTVCGATLCFEQHHHLTIRNPSSVYPVPWSRVDPLSGPLRVFNTLIAFER